MKRKRSVARAVWLLVAVGLVGLLGFWWWRSNPPLKQAPFTSNRPAGTAKLIIHNPQLISSPTQQATPHIVSQSQRTDTAPTNSVPPPVPRLAIEKTTKIPVDSTNGILSLVVSNGYPRIAQNVFEVQVVLARQGISSGSLDGLIGPQTRAALLSFQLKEHLPLTGQVDKPTRERLILSNAPTTTCIVSSNDLARLQPLSPTWLGKSQQTALEYETILELISERGQAHPGLVRRLNPDVNWTNVLPGTSVTLPEVAFLQPAGPAASLTIRLADKVLEAWDENTNLLAHFPCSIARRVEKRPVGELHVAVIAPHPNYTFDPENFPESSEAQQLKTKLVLPPGPNSPVGVVWIGLDKPGYGIHGTPNPEQVGRTESHGCFRLANWNAEYLLHLVTIGMPVYVQP